ncbi:MAG TPA: hypothetical protein VHA73_01310 [Acidimicrobiales bacterium]|jgi:8-oxo-dGTP pyrophosphatase MutT (NUDIX family)|nr:hypothetical protein [Acidimicrobiales bacterium]
MTPDAVPFRDVPVREAATVMLLRDGDDGVEVCMLQRQHSSAFVGGMYVFPGGAVDPEDHDPRWGGRISGLDPELASARLGVERDGLAYWVAAVRESLEECALFPALRADGTPWRALDEAEAQRFERHRSALDAEETDLFAICEEEDLRLDVGAMHYFARWITPPGPPRRYDTRFFLAAAPEGQVAVHDGRETIASRWVRPGDALAAEAEGTFTMLPPTVATLRALDMFGSTREALAVAAEANDRNAMTTHAIGDENGLRIPLPGEVVSMAFDAGPDVAGEPHT